MSFIPVSLDELNGESPDFVLITGDAYVDHPSFGACIIGRLLEHEGFSVGIIAQPDIRNDGDFKVFKKPKLGFLITSGNIDSMVNNYSVAKKKRDKDAYSPGGVGGLRPDRALTEYSKKVRKCYRDSPIILGGIEASLRRLAHYDYWADKILPSVLIDAKADIIVYGMGELQIIEIAQALKAGVSVKDLTYVEGTVYKTDDISGIDGLINLPSFKELLTDKMKYAESFLTQYRNSDHINAKTLAEKYEDFYIVQNIPARPMTTSELDVVYGLDYMRSSHPKYDEMGGVPALEEVQFSLISSRGCFGSCNFCALSHHQGRTVQVRSHESLLREADILLKLPGFKGYIHDVGGPTANFRHPSCKKQEKYGMCPDKKCLFPKPCKELNIDHKDYLSLLRKLRSLKGVKKVFVRSGIRYDYLIHDNNPEFLDELVKHHISGQLKVAPEHIAPKVLEKMGKPQREVYDRFLDKYEKANKKHGLKQFVVPYLMSSHPGSGLKEAIMLAEYLRDKGLSPKQVQDFYPTPSQFSTCMYYTGIDPRTKEPVYTPKSPHEKAMQRALIQYKLPQNYELVYEALQLAKRTDLIGFSKECLIRPRKTETAIRMKKAQRNEPAKAKAKKKTIRNIHKKKR